MVWIPMKLFLLNMPFIVEVVEVINGTCENPEQCCKSALIIPVLVSFKSWINAQSNKFNSNQPNWKGASNKNISEIW